MNQGSRIAAAIQVRSRPRRTARRRLAAGWFFSAALGGVSCTHASPAACPFTIRAKPVELRDVSRVMAETMMGTAWAPLLPATHTCSTRSSLPALVSRRKQRLASSAMRYQRLHDDRCRTAKQWHISPIVTNSAAPIARGSGWRSLTGSAAGTPGKAL
jgi:hypothetical protein